MAKIKLDSSKSRGDLKTINKIKARRQQYSAIFSNIKDNGLNLSKNSEKTDSMDIANCDLSPNRGGEFVNNDVFCLAIAASTG
jgi:hypothetical protein